MFFQPHHLGNAVHLVGICPRNMQNPFSAQFFREQFPLLSASGVSVEHRRIQRTPCPVRRHKSLTKAGNADTGNIRICLSHLSNYLPHHIQYGPGIHFMLSPVSSDRIIPVCLSHISAVFVKHRQLAACGSYIQSCCLHIFLPQSSNPRRSNAPASMHVSKPSGTLMHQYPPSHNRDRW